MPKGVRITDRDAGYAALVKRVIGMNPVTVAVGVLAKDAQKSHDEKTTILDIATINEFGSADGTHPPSRSFVRAWFDAEEPKIRELLVQQMGLAILGRLTRQQVLDRIGAYCVGQIQARVAQGIAPPNRPSTIAKKGSSTPLIDTGLLRSSVSFEIRERFGGGGT
jgi:hypothetical protein